MYIDKDAIIICTNVIYYFPHLRRQQEKGVGDMVFEGHGQSAEVSRPQFTPTWRVVCNEGPPWVGGYPPGGRGGIEAAGGGEGIVPAGACLVLSER